MALILELVLINTYFQISKNLSCVKESCLYNSFIPRPIKKKTVARVYVIKLQRELNALNADKILPTQHKNRKKS